MLRYSLSKLPNGKYYGELMSKGKDYTLSADVVHPNLNQLRIELGKKASEIAKITLSSFVKWRYLSLTKAGRTIWNETEQALLNLNMLASGMQYTHNIDAIARKLSEARVHLDNAKPKTPCHLWDELNELVQWAESYMGNKNQPQININ
jgi:hypothetical protein